MNKYPMGSSPMSGLHRTVGILNKYPMGLSPMSDLHHTAGTLNKHTVGRFLSHALFSLFSLRCIN